MRVSLIVAEGKREGKVIPIAVRQFMVGRHKQCQLRAASPAVSQHHCAVLVRGDEVRVRDFDSANGTFVNDERVQGERTLHNGDCLRIGPLLFLVWIEAVQPADDRPFLPPATRPQEPADESAIGALLLEESKHSPSLSILGLGEDGNDGSTIMKNRSSSPGTPGKHKPSRPGARSAPAASPLTLDAVRKMLDHYKRRPRS
jgi:predicted component of type VI protein secretion system